MSTKEVFLDLYFSVVLLGYATSIVLQLFVSEGGFLIGVAAFALTFLAGWLAQRKRREFPLALGGIWLVVGPVFVVLFLVTVLFSGYRGAPVTDDLPLLAERVAYNFSSARNVERWRYLLVSISFSAAWYSIGITVTIDLWRHWLSRIVTRKL